MAIQRKDVEFRVVQEHLPTCRLGFILFDMKGRDENRTLTMYLYASVPLNPLFNSTSNCTGSIAYDFGQNRGRHRRMDRQQQQKVYPH